MKQVVAVFGGSGFLGSYLVPTLLRRGFEVVNFDLKDCSANVGATFVELNILDESAVNKAFEDFKPDFVYNLAGFANLDKAVNFPLATFQLNVIGNLHLLEAVRKYGVKRFVYASSAYAMSDKGSFYGISKLSSEKVIEEYGRRYALSYTILRYGSIYSEADFENNYIFNLVKTAVNTGKIEHDGDGNEIREYIHASDAAKLSVDVIMDEQFSNRHLILTGVERMKRVELFRMINEILGNKIEIQLNDSGYDHHYKFTPYSFAPEESQKLIPNPYIDMGQGILNCIKKASS